MLVLVRVEAKVDVVGQVPQRVARAFELPLVFGVDVGDPVPQQPHRQPFSLVVEHSHPAGDVGRLPEALVGVGSFEGS